MNENIRAVFGLIGVWLLRLFAFMAEIQAGLQMIATIAAIIASLAYARYYWKKAGKKDE